MFVRLGSFIGFVALVVSLTASPALAKFQERSSDFDGDGYDDLAIGIPGKEVRGTVRAGAVVVLFGSETGLRASGSQLLHRGRGISGEPRMSEQLGSILAVGDFNGDGLADLAIGAPLAPIPDGVTGGAGNVTVLYGSASGLTAINTASDIDPMQHVFFGAALAAGDFDNDGFDELTVGVPTAFGGLGAVVIYRGSGDGLGLGDPTPLVLRKRTLGLGGAKHERFGSAVAAEDFNRDGFNDLAISSPGSHGSPGPPHGGDIVVLYGGKQGLALPPDSVVQVFRQGSNGIVGKQEPTDRFGAALVGADFDGRGASDLAIGVPWESFEGTAQGTIARAGAVNLIFGFTGLSPQGNQQWHQDSAGVGGAVEAQDEFGSSLGAGDFDGDGKYDLVIGVPAESFVGFDEAGVFHIIYGAPTAEATSRQQIWHQDSAGLAHGVEKGDRFGDAFGIGDFNGDGHQDLAVGAPGETLAGTLDAGAVLVLYGSDKGLTTLGSQLWAEHSPGLRLSASTSNRFGAALSNAGKMVRSEAGFKIRSPVIDEMADPSQ